MDVLTEALAGLSANGLLRRRRVLGSAQGPRAVVDGRPLVAFCSNDYLGLAAHPDLIAAVQRAASEAGVGAGASHLVCGHHELHHRLEERLATFVGLPAALLFSSGYLANLGVVTALVGRGDAVFGDRLNHASLNDAALLSRARLLRYRHLDLDHLDALLSASRARRKLVASDAVFSMDGDVAPVPELLALCERHDAWLLLDDAHGFGVLGGQGRGVLAHYGVTGVGQDPAGNAVAPRGTSGRLVYLATLGKAAGVSGAFVAGSATLVDWLVQRARTYVYTTATPPLLAAALLKSLELIEAADDRRRHLWQLIGSFRGRLRPGRARLLESATPIQPLVLGGQDETVAVARALEGRGLWVPAIRPPTVPTGQARLRISLCAAHTPAEVAELADALNGLEV